MTVVMISSLNAFADAGTQKITCYAVPSISQNAINFDEKQSIIVEAKTGADSTVSYTLTQAHDQTPVALDYSVDEEGVPSLTRSVAGIDGQQRPWFSLTLNAVDVVQSSKGKMVFINVLRQADLVTYCAMEMNTFKALGGVFIF